MTTTDQIRDAWLRSDDPTTRHAACVLSPTALRALATSATEIIAEREADSIVIPRDSLPEVEEVAMPGGTGTYDVGGIRLFEGPRNANDLRHRARAYLALAEHLAARNEQVRAEPTTPVPTAALDALRTAVRHSPDLNLAEAARDFDDALNGGDQ